MLLAEAERRRKGEGLTMRAFSRELGVSPALYCSTRKGNKPMRRKLAKAIMERYDDLRPLAVLEAADYLTGD